LSKTKFRRMHWSSKQQFSEAILIDNQVLNDVIQILDYSHFYSSKNAIIYSAMTNLETKNEPIDANTLKEELERLNKLMDVGGIEYILT